MATNYQLTLDVYAGERRRPAASALIAERLHQRGWITLPYDTAGGRKAGTIVPAWLCCRCGGAEVNAFLLDINHGCCSAVVPSCTLTRGDYRLGIALDAAWTPHHPQGRT
jgi:hypothetical protein